MKGSRDNTGSGASSLDPGSTASSLLEQVRAGEPGAWQRIVHVYGPLVYGWARRAGLQAADAADVMQEGPSDDEILVERWLQLGIVSRVFFHELQARPGHGQRVFQQPTMERIKLALTRRDALESFGVLIKQRQDESP